MKLEKDCAFGLALFLFDLQSEGFVQCFLIPHQCARLAITGPSTTLPRDKVVGP